MFNGQKETTVSGNMGVNGRRALAGVATASAGILVAMVVAVLATAPKECQAATSMGNLYVTMPLNEGHATAIPGCLVRITVNGTVQKYMVSGRKVEWIPISGPSIKFFAGSFVKNSSYKIEATAPGYYSVTKTGAVALYTCPQWTMFRIRR